MDGEAPTPHTSFWGLLSISPDEEHQQDMRLLTPLFVALAAGSAFGQTQPTDSSAYPTLSTERSTATEAINPSYESPNVPLPEYEAPDLNVNKSPDEDQAKSQFEAKGYLDVSGLQKDDRGIWRGAATLKDGRSVTVILDLQGNIYSKLPIADDQ